MNSRAQIILTDLLLYLIVLSFVLVFSLYLYSNLDINSSDELTMQSMQDYVDDLCDVLLKTGGNPNSWYLSNSDDIRTIGLACNSSYVISYDKLLRLREDNDLIYTVLPSFLKCNIVISSTSNSSNSFNIINSYTSETNKNIFTKEVPIIIDYGYNISNIYDNNSINSCPYNHLNSSNSWYCKSFNINKSQLNNSDVYLVGKDFKIMLSNSYGDSINASSKSYININKYLDDLITGSEDTIYIHISCDNPNNYLVFDYNNRPEFLNTIYDNNYYKIIIQVYR